jgi:Methyltransferase domain
MTSASPFTLYPLRRQVEPEWLDRLPAEDPRAMRSRRDLRRMNRIMGHAQIIRRVLRSCIITKTPRIAEIGAGDGTLMLRIVCAMQHWRGADVVLVDRQPVVSAATAAAYAEKDCRVTVAAADAFDWLSAESGAFDAIVANLFLHHFHAAQLERLFALAAGCARLFVACEPRRARFPLAGSRMLGLIGCNDVTRHDAVLSVRAGFRRRELSQIWPRAEGWTTDEGRAGLFSHCFLAERRDP